MLVCSGLRGEKTEDAEVMSARRLPGGGGGRQLEGGARRMGETGTVCVG